MISFTVYKPSGQIIRSGTCQAELISDQALGADETVIEEASDYKTQYMLGGKLTPRPMQSTAIDKSTLTSDGIDRINIAGVPTGANIIAIGTIPRNAQTIISNYFSTTMPDRYVLKISCFPFVDAVFYVEAI